MPQHANSLLTAPQGVLQKTDHNDTKCPQILTSAGKFQMHSIFKNITVTFFKKYLRLAPYNILPASVRLHLFVIE